jgi:NADP-dependent 3-hydroxy acid dehydrogenase YdfG
MEKSSVIGKVALITGGSRGIGEASARTLAKAGITVVLAARSEVEMKKIVSDVAALGGKAAYVVCDVAKESDLENAVSFCEKTFGGVDFIFANAGWEGPLNVS